eukprot:13929475-Alexandrium_andersonii.AAC.1
MCIRDSPRAARSHGPWRCSPAHSRGSVSLPAEQELQRLAAEAVEGADPSVEIEMGDADIA